MTQQAAPRTAGATPHAGRSWITLEEAAIRAGVSLTAALRCVQAGRERKVIKGVFFVRESDVATFATTLAAYSTPVTPAATSVADVLPLDVSLTDPDGWITTYDAARRINASPAFVYRLRSQGVLTFRKNGRRVFILAASVDAYIERTTVRENR